MNQNDVINNSIMFNTFDELSKKDSDTHIKNQTYSSEIFYHNLVEQLKEVRGNIRNIQQEIEKTENNKKKLLSDLRKNERIFRELLDKLQSVRLNSSVDTDNLNISNKSEIKIKKDDDKLNNLDSEIAKKKEDLESLSNYSNLLSKRRFKKREEKLKIDIERLSKKKNVIKDRQTKIINSKLNSYYSKLAKKSKAYGREHAIEELRLERFSRLDDKSRLANKNISEYEMKAKNSSFFVSKFLEVKKAFSYAHKGILNKYCIYLKHKDSILNAMRRVDPKIAEQVRMMYSDSFDSVIKDTNVSNIPVEPVDDEENKKEENKVVQSTVEPISQSIVQPVKSSVDKDAIELSIQPNSDINMVANALMLQKSYGVHCYVVFNGIKYDNEEYDNVDEIIEAYQDELTLNSTQGRSK